MDIGMICFSREGEITGRRIKKELSSRHEVWLDCKSRSTSVTIDESLSSWTERNFRTRDAIVFISAAGIAVRAIAPFVSSKETDPAIVVVDEKGTFAISLMSGHLGGANELAEEIGRLAGAVPVITTASDINGLLAPDLFAAKNGLIIDDIHAAGKASAAIVNGEKVLLFTDMEFARAVPEYVLVRRLERLAEPQPEGMKKIIISPHVYHKPEDPEDTWLIPQNVNLGIGCRRGTPAEKIKEAVDTVLSEYGIDRRAVRRVASIDLKEDEEGLLRYCSEEGLDIRFYSEEELLKAEGSFSSSEFVRKITGVESVCERSAVTAAGPEPELIIKKQVRDRVTVAAAVSKEKLRFE